MTEEHSENAAKPGVGVARHNSPIGFPDFIEHCSNSIGSGGQIVAMAQTAEPSAAGPARDRSCGRRPRKICRRIGDACRICAHGR